MMKHFLETQNIHNAEVRKQSLDNNETLRQLNNAVESLMTHNEALEAQISMLSQTPLGPSPEENVYVVTTNSEK